MWRFRKLKLQHRPDCSVVWITFSVDFNLLDGHQRITNKPIQARRNSDEWKGQQNWNNFCGMNYLLLERMFFAWWIAILRDNRAILLSGRGLVRTAERSEKWSEIFVQNGNLHVPVRPSSEASASKLSSKKLEVVRDRRYSTLKISFTIRRVKNTGHFSTGQSAGLTP